ncbi:MAG: DsbA family protein [Geminicoccaceae bacterium]|nr:DsbA family protein [Geminicoccaceae bacterium]MCX8102172.1 DsbA family protein [Geminicoccaceae bacterium]
MQHGLGDPQDRRPGDRSEDAAPQQSLAVTLVADLVCPWCRIALATLAPLADRLGVAIRWAPFLLNPGLPPQGVPRRLYLERKFGSLEAARLVERRILRRGRELGLDFAFDRIARQPDTTAAHALLHEAERRGLLVPTAVRLFAAFFEEGQDLGDRAVLARLAAAFDLDAAGLAEALSADRLVRVRAEHRRAVARGIDGVPALLLPRVGVLAGAQPAEVVETFLEIGLLDARSAEAQGRQGS